MIELVRSLGMALITSPAEDQATKMRSGKSAVRAKFTCQFEQVGRWYFRSIFLTRRWC